MLPSTLRRVTLLLLFLGCLTLPACSHFTQAGRQQAAYAKYVRKQSHNRVRQQTKFKKTKVPSAPMQSEPTISAGSSGGPQSVSSGESGQQ